MTRNTKSFEQWIATIFGAANWTYDQVELPAPIAVDYMTRLCEHAWDVLSVHSDQSVAEGLRAIFLCASDFIAALDDESAPLLARTRWARSIFGLFEQYFARKCTAHFKGDPPDENPLNSVCFMWWDLFPTPGEGGSETFLALNWELLQVMRSCLGLASPACWESALHGLGHWQVDYPDEVAAYIDEFLAGNPNLHAELRAYALEARDGAVQ